MKGVKIEILKCNKCKSTNILTIAKQKRSVDEGSKLFNRCQKCKNKWCVSV